MSPVQDLQQRTAPFLLPLSLGLIGAGVLVLGFVLTEAYGVYADLASNKFIADLTVLVTDKPIPMPNGGVPILLQNGAARIAAVVLFVMLASMGASVGLGLIKAGVQLISPRYEEQIARLRQRMDELARQSGK